MPLAPAHIDDTFLEIREPLSPETHVHLADTYRIWHLIETDSRWQSRVRLETQLAKVRGLTALPVGWDGYDADAPATAAAEAAAKMLVLFYSNAIDATDVVPTAEGGVAIVFSASDSVTQLEILNTDEIVWLGYRGRIEPQAEVFQLSDAGMGAAFERIQDFLSQ